jgi:hypothetical protein
MVVNDDYWSTDEAVLTHLTHKVKALLPEVAEIVGSGGMDDENDSGYTPRRMLHTMKIGTRCHSPAAIYIVWKDYSDVVPIGLAGWFYQEWTDEYGREHEREIRTETMRFWR